MPETNIKKTKLYELELKLSRPDIKVLSFYINSKTKILHGSNFCMHTWLVTPNNILSKGSSCPRCNNINRKNRNKKSIGWYNSKINRNISCLSTEFSSKLKLLHKCLKCKNEWRSLSGNILSGHGCPKCANLKRREKLLKSMDKYSRELKSTRSDVISIENYKGNKIKILHKCLKCENEWRVTPNQILSKESSCPECYNLIRGNKILFSKKSHYESALKGINSSINILENYKGNKIKILHKCLKCENEWRARPDNILFNNSACPKCSRRGYSKVAIAWLESISLDIQHAENGGEYNILGTKLRADGYDPENNTIYEFLGDCWHGNPSLFEGDERCHPFNDKTASGLYSETIDRFRIINELGYKIVYIWENDYRRTINDIE